MDSPKLPEPLGEDFGSGAGFVPPQTLEHLYTAASERVEIGTMDEESFERIIHSFLHNSFGGLFRGSAET